MLKRSIFEQDVSVCLSCVQDEAGARCDEIWLSRCETTAREAMVRDFHVFFLSNGTTTFGMGNASAAEFQKAPLATLGFLFTQGLTVDEMLQKIGHAARTTEI
jgi:hypothetical protein